MPVHSKSENHFITRIGCNHYVHGSPGGFDYSTNGDLVTFLTSALEFLFAASDLVDSGWDLAGWRGRGSVLAHPFSRVLHMWDQNATRIRELCERTSAESRA